MSLEAQDNAHLYYDAVIMVKHPAWDPDLISRQLKREPHISWRVGAPRAAPNGKPLPGINKQTYWTTAERIKGDRYFFTVIMELVETLETAREFVNELIAKGGTINLIAQLPGSVNIGDSLAPSDLLRIAQLGIKLGVEVFPHMRE